MITLGISGGMGSGKSYVCKTLSVLHDIPVFNCDLNVKKILNQPTGLGDRIVTLKEKLINLCGEECYTSDNKWDVKYIAKLAEADKTILDKISVIIESPLIIEILQFKLAHIDKPFCAIESALFPKSSKLRNHVDKMVLVTAPLDLRIQRIKERDPHRSDNDIITLLYNQIAPDIKIDHTLENGAEQDIDIEDQIAIMIKEMS